jgi:hypothetical protein
MRVSLGVLFVILMSDGCKPADMASAPMSPSTATDSGPASAPASASPSPSTPVVDGELTTKAEVIFEVRPLGGPGTMGPTVLSAKSDRALQEIRAYLEAHPDAGPLRIECAINPTRMSSSPDAKWPAGLSLQIARWLVDHAIDCKRLEAIGWLDRELNPPPFERVRFFIDPHRQERPPGKEARLDVCAALK